MEPCKTTHAICDPWRRDGPLGKIANIAEEEPEATKKPDAPPLCKHGRNVLHASGFAARTTKPPNPQSQTHCASV